MPAAWTDTFDQTTDWSQIDFLNMFPVALWERAYAIDPPIPPQFPVSVGDDAQSAGFGSAVIGSWQGYVMVAILGFSPSHVWLKPTFDPEGLHYDRTDPTPWQSLSPWWDGLAEVQAAAGYSDSRDSHGRSYAIAEESIGWIRKKARTITSTADTKDTDGNPISNGMRAEMEFVGELYVRTAGAWVRTTYAGGPPDTLTSSPGNPRTITSTSDATDTAGNAAASGMRAELGADIYQHDGTSWVLDAGTLNAADRLQTGSGCAFGVCQAGDYIGYWLFNQLRDVLHTIGKRTDGLLAYYSPGQYGTGASHYDDITGSEPVFTTESDAVDDALARWTCAPLGNTSAGVIAAVALGSQGTVHSQFPSIVASILKKSMTYSVDLATHRSKTVSYVGVFESPDAGGSGVLSVYDTQGEPNAATTEDTFHVWDSVAYLAIVSIGTNEMAVNTCVAPSNYTNLPFTDPANPGYVNTTTGFRMSAIRAIIEWDFTYP